MATLDDLVKQGSLVALQVPLEPNQRAWRRLYGLPDFVQWLDKDLPNLQCTWANSDPQEQLGALFISYIIGEELIYTRQIREIKPVKHGVWELKTVLLRVFGWFYYPDCFICAFGNLADKVKDHGLYHGYLNETVRVRRELSLDKPNFVQGVNYHDVLSNAPD